ncbi:hypothetical protein pneo_cds_540 [Pandoravirus neocaledonia]|uniref:Uncharacterized protein n=1 Tax=Pandoravirus neocaledonia TaxID=2107708 RepID=A0A2U7UCJ6_9VIRU|nr:hypothetical protein pneo_cds_540 [Pandoravirus neocaledonia]AVK76147.1 hypothetical protein pneo_cds_540 [Pandoravirus neocaledonia]
MSASEYPGAEQDAQRLIDQFDALVLEGGRRPQDMLSLSATAADDDDRNEENTRIAEDNADEYDEGDDEAAAQQEAVARLSSALLNWPASNRPRVALDHGGEPHGARIARRSVSTDGADFLHARRDEVDDNADDWNDADGGMNVDDIDDLDRLLDDNVSRADMQRDLSTRPRFDVSTTRQRAPPSALDDEGDDGDDDGDNTNAGSPFGYDDGDDDGDNTNAGSPFGYADGDGDDDDDSDGLVIDTGSDSADLDRISEVGSRYKAAIEYDDIDWGDGPSEGQRARDGRPPLAPHAIGTHAQSSPRVVHIARGIVDDGYTVLAIDEHRLAPGGTGAYTNLNGEAYATADLVAYLYAEEPASKSVPHTRQRLTQAQVNGLLALMAAGHAHLVAPADVDGAAYALTRPLSSPTDALSHEAAATVDAHLEAALVDEERAVDLAAYHAAALVHYAIEIAMAIGWDYKPAVNFAIARYISAAGTPLLAEEGGLLPDEIPRRRHPHRRRASTNARGACPLATDLCDDRGGTDANGNMDTVGNYDDMDDDDNYDDDDENQEGAPRDGGGGQGERDEGDIAIPAETRDEAVARHRALADRRRRHPPMGMDLELVAAVLQAEADDGGLERSPANLDEMRRRLRTAVGARLKPSKADRKIDRYAVPWAYGVCCALDRRDVDEVLASPAGAAAVAERVNRAWAVQSAGGGPDDGTAAPGRKPPRPLAPYLSDAEFAQRLARLDPPLLAALSRVIPLEARGRSDLDAGDYVIYESNLALGAPLSPPMAHSLAQKVMRFARQAGTTPRACDLAPKPPAIVFVRDCPQT